MAPYLGRPTGPGTRQVPQIPGLAGAPRNFTVRGPQSLQSHFSLVPTGAARPPPRRSRLPQLPRVVESIFHQLYLCPLAKRVWDWVIRVWEEVSGQPVLDLGPCELLLGRGGPFRPQKSQGLGVAATIIGHAARLLANNQISNTISAAIQPAGSMAHAARPIEAASVDRCGVCHQARHDERACFA